MNGWRRSKPGSERGSIAISGLVFVAVITLLGVALFDLAAMESRLAGEREARGQAFYTADSGLQAAWFNMAKNVPTFDTVFAATLGTSVATGSVAGAYSYSVAKVALPVTTAPEYSIGQCGTYSCIQLESTGNGPTMGVTPGSRLAKIRGLFSRSAPIFTWGAFGTGNVSVGTQTAILSYDPTICPVGVAPPCDYCDPSTGCSPDNRVMNTSRLVGAGTPLGCSPSLRRHL